MNAPATLAARKAPVAHDIQRRGRRRVPTRASGIKTFTPLTAVHAASVFENEISENDIGAPRAQIDDEYMRNTGLADRVEDWRDIAREALGGVAVS